MRKAIAMTTYLEPGQLALQIPCSILMLCSKVYTDHRIFINYFIASTDVIPGIAQCQPVMREFQ